MKRGVGYCENTDCEDYAKGVFLPLAMLLACLWQPLRERMLPWLAVGAVPGLFASWFAWRGELIVFGNAQVPLALALAPNMIELITRHREVMRGGGRAREEQGGLVNNGALA